MPCLFISSSSTIQTPSDHRSSTSCLCERLSVLDQSAAASSGGSARKPPSSDAAIKVLFKSFGGGNGSNHRSKPANGSKDGSFFPELQRTKSFSAAKNEARRGCRVTSGVRSTLYSLFHQDDGGRGTTSFHNRDSSSSVPTGPEFEAAVNCPETEIEPETLRIEEDEIKIENQTPESASLKP